MIASTSIHSPTYTDTPISGPTSFADHESSLWRAVIPQALMDAATASRKPEARRIKADAVRWLLTPSEDFDTVCDHAGLDPDYVRSRAIAALERQYVWRLPAGQGWRAKAREAALADMSPSE